MSLEKLDYILAVAEAQTLTRAAKQLYISQPTLSNYINKLEEELGVKLFDRSVTPVRVTKAGALYIERMKKIQKDSDTLLGELRRMGRQETVFHLGIGNTRGCHWLPVILPEFGQRYPNVTIQLTEQGEDELEKGVLNGTIDMAYGVLNTSYPELYYEPLLEETVLLVIPRSYPCVAHLEPWVGTISNPYYIDGADIGQIPFLLPYPGRGFYRCANMLLEQAGIHPGRVCNYTNMDTAYQLAAGGLGALFITPEFFNQRYPDCRSKLAFCSLQNPAYTRRSVIGYRTDNPNMEMLRTMVQITQRKLVPLLKSM